MIDLSFLAQAEPEPAAPPPSPTTAAGYVIMAATGGIAGGVLGWKLDGAPGMAFGAATGTVMGVVLANLARAKAERDVRRMFA